MAISKLILNGETQMDVTSNTNTASNMLDGVVGTKNDGTSVTGNIASKSSNDLTVSGATVTAPAGYYANAASKAVATVAHPKPTAVLYSSAAAVTASHTQETGYVTGGTTTTVLDLPIQAAKTVTPTESAQTAVASYRWTTGNVNVAAISSTYVGTGVTTRSSADLTANGSVVTAPAGYYSTAATKSIAAGSAFSPAVTITKAPTIGVNTSGVVTASYNGSSSITPTVNVGYVSQGTAGTISTTGTSTYQLTSQAAATYYPSTADQTIASQRWLVGNQTIKSVTTSNLTAANIAEGVTVKVGDANNASRITQITGTHSGATSYTATISGTGGNGISLCYVQHNNETTKYYTNGDTIIFKEGDTFTFTVDKYPTGGGSIYLNDELITTKTGNTVTYTWTAPVGNINIILDVSRGSIRINTLVMPTGVTALSSAGTHNVYSYSQATIAEGSAFPPATTITQAPLFNISSSTGMITASYTGSSSITPTVISGWISQGTSGVISTTGTNIYQLPTQSATTYYPSTADQTISSYRWLIGNQTIASVTTTNLVAQNIAEGVVVKVGDANNASRITQITGTHSGGPTYTVTLEGNYWNGNYITYNNTTYNTNGATFEFTPGNTMHIYVSHIGGVVLYKDGEYIGANQSSINHNYVLPSCDVTVKVYTAIDQDNQEYSCVEINREHLDIVDNGKYEVAEYGYANVNVSAKYTATLISNGTYDNHSYIYNYVRYNNINYYTQGNTFEFSAGDILTCRIVPYNAGTNTTIYEDGEIKNQNVGQQTYSYTLPAHDINISFLSTNSMKIIVYPTLSITTNGNYDVKNYGYADVSLPTQAAQTFYTSTVDQTISSGVYLTGDQTIKGVTTSNLTAANIAEGVTVQVGDVNNASRITQVTGTHSGPQSYTATISGTGSSSACYVQLNGGTKYYTNGDSFTYKAGDTLYISCGGLRAGGTIIINGETVVSDSNYSVTYTMPLPAHDINISITYGSFSTINVSGGETISITTNGTYNVDPYGTANVDVTTDSGGGYTVDQIAMRTISGSISGSATTIGSYTFYYCSALTTASFPSATRISADAFAFCYSLTTISFPSATSIGHYTFNSCSALTTASFPNVTSIGNYAFWYCSALTTVSFPKATYIGMNAFNCCYSLTTASFPSATIISNYAFAECYSLTTASFPNVTSIGASAFNYCLSLTTASFPSATIISNGAFNSCYSLTTTSFPNVTSIGSNAFYYCSALTTASFPKVTSIGNFAFRSCRNLLSFYLLGSSIPTLGASVFYSTPIGGYTTGDDYGSIFVPASLYSSYLTATNWSVYSSRIVSV